MNTRLLFFWINENDNGFIERTGLNFSVEFKFSLEVTTERTQIQYKLRCTNNTDQRDLWKNAPIAGLTALVGENGSGKTSVFRSLYYASIGKTHPVPDDDYRRYHEEQNRKNTCLAIYEKDSNVVIYHNFPANSFINETGYSDVFGANELEGEDYSRVFGNLSEQSIVYLSNGSYTESFKGIFTSDKLEHISLTPATITSVQRAFIGKMHFQTFLYSGNFLKLQELLRSRVSLKDCQMIFDICDFSFSFEHNTGEILKKNDVDLLSQKNSENEMARRLPKLIILVDNPVLMIRHTKGNSEFGTLAYKAKKQEERFSSKAYEYIKWLQQTGENDSIVMYLCDSLLYELIVVFGRRLKKTRPNTTDRYIRYLSRIIGTEKGKATDQAKLSLIEYYECAVEELKTLAAIIDSCEQYSNSLPRRDLAYQHGCIVSPENPECYSAFCAAISKIANDSHSVILKYLSISNYEYSSGERALQNFFSWLLIPPNYHTLIGTGINHHPASLRKNMLLLIDEFDLYMHPEWQRKALKTLIDGLSARYSDSNIQIILATHSPLLLSDIPIQNCVFLKKQERCLTIEDNLSLRQTFGANVHILLQNAFFLDRTIGEYAFQLILTISKKLSALLDDKGNLELREECKPYLWIINSIGDPILHRKLITKYNRCFPLGAELNKALSLADQVKTLCKEMPAVEKQQAVAELQRVVDDLRE